MERRTMQQAEGRLQALTRHTKQADSCRAAASAAVAAALEEPPACQFFQNGRLVRVEQQPQALALFQMKKKEATSSNLSLNPVSATAAAMIPGSPPRSRWMPPVYAKTLEQRLRLAAAVSKGFIFAGLQPHELTTLVDAFAEYPVPAGTRVIEEGKELVPGEPALFVVEEGTLDVYKNPEGGATVGTSDGAPVFTYDTPGQYFGELAVLYGGRRAATVRARTAAKLWTIDTYTFQHLLRQPARVERARRAAIDQGDVKQLSGGQGFHEEKPLTWAGEDSLGASAEWLNGKWRGGWAPSTGTGLRSALDTCFPTALPDPEVLRRSRLVLGWCGLTPDNTILARSTCPDEVNNRATDLSNIMASEWGGRGASNFNMGGLGGLPFVGKTGFTAYAHHVPENGNLMILFASHAGMTPDGEIGKYLRRGQTQKSAACGASTGGFAAACKLYDNPPPAVAPAAKASGAGGPIGEQFLDAQEEYLIQKLVPQVPWIRQAATENEKGARLAEATFQIVKEMVLELVEQALPAAIWSGDPHSGAKNGDFEDEDEDSEESAALGRAGFPRVALLGGIELNMPAPFDGHFVPRFFELRRRDRAPVDLLPRLEELSLPDMIFAQD